MLGFSWLEIGVIMMVALVVIGPKDLPVAIRTASAGLRKMRGLANEFQGHVQDLMREADLADVGNDLRNLRNFDLGGVVERHLDPDGELRGAFDPASGDPEDMSLNTVHGDDLLDRQTEESMVDAPAFIPPDAARQKPVPAFIPPGTRLW